MANKVKVLSGVGGIFPTFCSPFCLRLCASSEQTGERERGTDRREQVN